MMCLPIPPSGVRIQSFWCVLSLVSGLLVGYLLAPLFSINGYALAILMIVGFAVPGLLFPRIGSVPYRAFNKLVGFFAYYLMEVVLLICFCIVRTAGRKNGFSLQIDKPHDFASLWVEKEPHVMNCKVPQGEASVRIFPQKTWYSTFARWAMSSDNGWMLALVPHMILISNLSTKHDSKRVPSQVYTLY